MYLLIIIICIPLIKIKLMLFLHGIRLYYFTLYFNRKIDLNSLKYDNVLMYGERSFKYLIRRADVIR